jgi:hypothetical protein
MKPLHSKMAAQVDGEFVVFLIGVRINRPWKLSGSGPAAADALHGVTGPLWSSSVPCLCLGELEVPRRTNRSAPSISERPSQRCPCRGRMALCKRTRRTVGQGGP